MLETRKCSGHSGAYWNSFTCAWPTSKMLEFEAFSGTRGNFKPWICSCGSCLLPPYFVVFDCLTGRCPWNVRLKHSQVDLRRRLILGKMSDSLLGVNASKGVSLRLPFTLAVYFSATYSLPNFFSVVRIEDGEHLFICVAAFKCLMILERLMIK